MENRTLRDTRSDFQQANHVILPKVSSHRNSSVILDVCCFLFKHINNRIISAMTRIDVVKI